MVHPNSIERMEGGVLPLAGIAIGEYELLDRG